MKSRAEHTDFAGLARHLDISLEKPLGLHAWRGRTQSGNTIVLKTGPGATSQLFDFLVKLKSLYPPFAYPHVISAEPGFYLIYAFIPGNSLSERELESENTLAAAFELSGRITALFRSLKLAPMFQGLQENSATPQDSQGFAARRLAALGSGVDYQFDGLAIRRWEASQSYSWAQHIVTYCASRWPGDDPCPADLWLALRHRVEAVTSIHLTPHGSNLAHTCFTPEHVLTCPEDHWGIVGWQVAPRPYNYMRYRYLAWCLVHTDQGEIAKRYRHFLAAMPSIQYSAANCLTFVLCLMETWVETKRAINLRAEKLQAFFSFIEEALSLTVPDNPAVQ